MLLALGFSMADTDAGLEELFALLWVACFGWFLCLCFVLSISHLRKVRAPPRPNLDGTYRWEWGHENSRLGHWLWWARKWVLGVL